MIGKTSVPEKVCHGVDSPTAYSPFALEEYLDRPLLETTINEVAMDMQCKCFSVDIWFQFSGIKVQECNSWFV